MLEKYRIAYSEGKNEIVEKKSRFIATTFPINSEEEATLFIESIRKKYWDARHHCFAYVMGDKHQIQRFSDDGEPSGTAGKPMLDILLGEDIHNVLVVVTRYFGGTLLGTGGLVRAYSKATKAGLINTQIIEKKFGCEYEITIDYNGVGKLQYIIEQMNLATVSIEYTDIVTMKVVVAKEDWNAFEKKAIEGTNGKVKIEPLNKVYFALIDGKVSFI